MAFIDFVPVDDLGNASDNPDSNGLTFGGVDYSYNIAKYETTYGQYVEFLNAVAKSDPYQLFNDGMQIDKLLNGISRSDKDGNYRYNLLDSDSANKPVNYVNFLDAIRFTNWMHNGQGAGDTESGAYAITTAQLVGATRRNNIATYKVKGVLDVEVGDQAQFSGLTGSGFDARSTITSIRKTKKFTFLTIENENPNGIAWGTGILTVIPATHASDAKYWIPTENEWYKAAYYNPTLNSGAGGYYDWATQSDSTPGNTIGDLPNQANIRTTERFTNSEFFPKPDPVLGPNMLTAVGSFTNSASYYGTFDMDGNLTEWNESIYDQTSAFGDYNASGNGTRSKRGASFYNSDSGTQSRDDGLMPNDAGYASGFRLASASNPAFQSNLSSSKTQDSTLSGNLDSPQSKLSVKPQEYLGSPVSRNPLNFLGSFNSKIKRKPHIQPSYGLGQSLIYEGILSSNNELWTTTTPATGKIKFILNAERTQATYELNVIGLDFGKWFDGQPRTTDTGDDVAGMHFHHAPFFTVGDVCIGLINPNQEKDLTISYDNKTTTWTLKGIWTDDDRSVLSLTDSLQYIYKGELYTNIHTERVALGEIRAQFSPLAQSTTSRLMADIAPYAASTSSHHSDHSTDTSPHTEDHCEETSHQPEDCDCCHGIADANIQESVTGTDWLTGLDGKDVFCYDSLSDSHFKHSDRDKIQNFDASEDVIKLRGLDANSTREGIQGFVWISDQSFTPFTPGQLRNQNGVISADLDSNLRADFSIFLAAAPAFTADNLIL